MDGNSTLYNQVNSKIAELIKSHSDLESEVQNLKLIIRLLRAKINRGDLEDAKEMLKEIHIDERDEQMSKSKFSHHDEAARHAWWKVRFLLLRIEKERLYQDDFSTFSDYLLECYGISEVVWREWRDNIDE